jgi:DNA polymerase-1
VYWKDEIKDWDEKWGELQYWAYNCKDACITYEIDSVLTELAVERGGAALEHTKFQQSLFFPVLRMAERGLRRDALKHKAFSSDLLKLSFERQEKLNWVVGHELNPKSPKQLLDLFYKDLGIPGIRALGSESLSTNSPTLALIAERDPMLAPLCQLIAELRSIGVFLSTFINAGLDADGRMRTSFNIAGTTSYRFASRENAFNSGMNFQNIPLTTKQKIKSPDYVKLPNIRELFIPDPGYTCFDLDLDRADMQVVGRESNDQNLIDALAQGIDLHCFSASEVFGFRGIPIDELIESHPNYPEHRARIGKANRDKCKNGGHACDYAVGDRKLAQTLGITVKEAADFKAKWFGLFPGIHAWHRRTEELVSKQGFIENRFGARLYLFGRFNLPEFLGWLPQSTVSGVINRALVAIDAAHETGETLCELLIQVHDSLVGQFPTNQKEKAIADLRKLASIIVPYENPLTIPVGIKTSTQSWGAVK